MRTPYGVAHVTAPDFAGLGYGAAYAFSQDNFCILAGQLVTVHGDRSKDFGAEGATNLSFNPATNIDSDFFFRSVPDLPALREAFSRTSEEHRDLIQGWVAGYNRYLQDTPPAKRPAECAEAQWVGPMTLDDVLLMTDYRARYMSAAFLGGFIVSAQPPAAAAVAQPQKQSSLTPDPEHFGSNAWAFGRETTTNGSGLLLGNPHVPWSGGIRFFEVHLTVPGKLDVMGVMNAGGPFVTMGFNHDVAWSHTVANDRHFTLFELALDPADPTTYLVDGKPQAMKRATVSVDTGPNGPPQSRTLYSTIYGPIFVSPLTPWSATRAYALGDSNANNQREGDTWLAMARARSVGELRKALERTTGISWSNTIAADRHGDALFADITAVPNVSADKLAGCAPKGVPQGVNGFYVLDGTRSACAWEQAPGTTAPGLMPGAAMPALVRADYVQNANDSYWLTNPQVRMEAFSPVLGRPGIIQGPRTRAGLAAIKSRLDGSDGLGGRQVDAERVKAMLFANRSFIADQVLDDLLIACGDPAGATADVAAGCAVLRKWDRRMDAASAGGMLFAEFWRRASAIPNIWRVPFDAADPVGTPRGLNMSGPAGAKILEALGAAVGQMRSQGLTPDAPLGNLQFVTQGAERIAIHGGESSIGVLNAISSRFSPADRGYKPWTGSTFIQIVTFDARGPVADAVLTHSQSSDPASPHAVDQTRLYAAKHWVRLPFLKADIDREAVGSPLRITQ